MTKHYSIAIDGPSGAGKSTIAKAVAERFSFVYLDTGAIYRTVAYALLKNNTASEDEENVKKLLETMDIKIEHDENGVQQMLLDGDNVSDEIRSPEVSMCASKSSALPVVRNFLIKMQRDFAAGRNAILDGRDIGTVVLPDADVKIFLDAKSEIRAMRRYKELILKYPDTDFDKVYRDLVNRDKNDSGREFAPLKPAADSVILDTSLIGLGESIEKVCSIISERLGL